MVPAMRVLVVGANGKIGRQVVALLGDTEHQAVAVVRDQAQTPPLVKAGAEFTVRDLERDVDGIADGCDAVIFSAGSGGHTGGDKTLLVDLWGAVKVLRAAEAAKVDHFVMVSAIGAADPDRGHPRLRHYLVAKRFADDELVRSPIAHTIVRPGRLTDALGTGTVRAGADTGHGDIARADVAAAIVACLGNLAVRDKTFCLIAGGTPIDQALRSV